MRTSTVSYTQPAGQSLRVYTANRKCSSTATLVQSVIDDRSELILQDSVLAEHLAALKLVKITCCAVSRK